MIRKSLPYWLILIAVLLDTSIVPVFYAGILTIPLTLVVTFCVSLTLGKVRGLLIDITAGTLGTMTFYFLITGFLVDLILDTGNPNVRRVLNVRMRVFRGIVVFALYEPDRFVRCRGARTLREAGVEVRVYPSLAGGVREANAHLQ